MLGGEPVHGPQLRGLDHVVDAAVPPLLLRADPGDPRRQGFGLDRDEPDRQYLSVIGEVDRVEHPRRRPEALLGLPGLLEVLERLAGLQPAAEHGHDHALARLSRRGCQPISGGGGGPGQAAAGAPASRHSGRTPSDDLGSEDVRLLQ
jgi:hypothetical protein